MISKLIQNMKKKNILILGDVLLDRFIYCKTDRISSETTIPVFQFDFEKYVVGGAGNVAVNISAGGQNAYICSIIGDDSDGKIMIDYLRNYGVNTDYLVIDKIIKNTVKTRFLNNLNQQVFRFDTESKKKLSDVTENNIIVKIEKNIDSFDGIILSDYSYNFLSEYIAKTIIKIAQNHDIPILVDIRNDKPEKYSFATYIKPNIKDLESILDIKIQSREQLQQASQSLCAMLHSKYVITTCGSDGIILVDQKNVLADEPSCKIDVADVTGAGDTVCAYFMIGLTCGLTPMEAMKMANIAAGIKVQKVGTQPVAFNELIESNKDGKIISVDDLKIILPALKGKKIVFTCGCFDLMHVGHLRYLIAAKQMGDVLIIGLNSDSSVRKIKGANRPINSQALRAEFLSDLGFVDYIVIFDEPTSDRLIEIISPQVFVKGGDYLPDQIPEAITAKKVGAVVKVMDCGADISTSKLIKAVTTND